MADFRVSGGAGVLYLSEGNVDFSASAETAEGLVLETDLLYPLGPDGDAVFRRLWLPLSWEVGISARLRVWVDEVEIEAAKGVLIRSGAGREPLEATLATRGSSLRARVEIDPPTGRLSLEGGLSVALTPGARARRR